MDRQSQKITALYCRLAHYTDDFDTHKSWHQRETLLQYAIKNGLENPCFYCDWGFSGTTFNRPELQSMLREIKEGNVENLVVLDLSRLTRDSFKCGELMEVTLPEHGVKLHSIKDGISPHTADPMQPCIRVLLDLCRASERGGRE